MCKVDRENYEKYWDDINPFVKFGCIKDEKFRDKIKDYIIFKNLDKKYITLKDYLESAKKPEEETVKEEQTVEETDTQEQEKKKTIIYYVTDEQQQSQYINMFKEEGIDAVILTHRIDQPFISQLERDNETVKFQRIDADLTESFKEDLSKEDSDALKQEAETLTNLFRKALNKE